MTLKNFLSTLDRNSQLHEYTQALLGFYYQDGRINFKLKQPECVIKLDGTQLGPSNIESYIEVNGIKISFDKTVQQAIDIL